MQPHRIYRRDDWFDTIAHPAEGTQKGVIINLPGYRGSIDGYNNKYVTLGEDLARRGFRFVRMPNTERPVPAYAGELCKDLRAVIRAEQSLLSDTPVYLMGFSAGGFAVATVAPEFESVKAILLMEPSANVSLLGQVQAIKLKRFLGEAYIVIGDNGVGREVGELYYDAFTFAKRRELVVIDNCDHQFTGKRNGQIMAKAPLWAFAGDTTFPSPDGGLVLYD